MEMTSIVLPTTAATADERRTPTNGERPTIVRSDRRLMSTFVCVGKVLKWQAMFHRNGPHNGRIRPLREVDLSGHKLSRCFGQLRQRLDRAFTDVWQEFGNFGQFRSMWAELGTTLARISRTNGRIWSKRLGHVWSNLVNFGKGSVGVGQIATRFTQIRQRMFKFGQTNPAVSFG